MGTVPDPTALLASTRRDARTRAMNAFIGAFAARPAAGARAPGRVNLMGDHTDYAGGRALPAAMQLDCVAVADALAPPGTLHIVASDLTPAGAAPLRLPLDPIALRAALDASPAAMRAAHAAGTAALAVESLGTAAGGVGVRLALASDVPIGSGLSSSAAVEVAVATALDALLARHVAVDDRGATLARALLCQRAEHLFAGSPCGLMDQLVSVAAHPGHAMRIDFADRTWLHVPLPPGAAFVVFDTGHRHNNADDGYVVRRNACDAAARDLAGPHLARCEPTPAQLAALDDAGRTAVAHVVSETRRVDLFAAALTSERLDVCGGLMNESHGSLSRFGVSTQALDALAAAALSHGALGARLTGAGLGGCVLALFDAAHVDRSTAAIRAAWLARTGVDCRPLHAIPSAGASPLDLN